MIISTKDGIICETEEEESFILTMLLLKQAEKLHLMNERIKKRCGITK